jgi:hypothetical protein
VTFKRSFLTVACIISLFSSSCPVAAITPTGTWTNGATGAGLSSAHVLGGAALLGNGKVVVAGGLSGIAQGVTGAELYDPATQSWSSTSSMNSKRWSFDAITLSNGSALFAGGSNAFFDLLGSGFVRSDAEIYDSNTNSFFSTINNLSVARHAYGISALNDGRILIAGGSTLFNHLGGTGTTAVDIYDPTTNQFSSAGSMNAGRSLHAQTTLADGRVVVVGGAQNDAEVFDPNTNLWTSSLNTMATTLKDTKAFELYNGKVFIAAGQNTANGVTSDNTWLFDPDSLTFATGPSMAGFNSRDGTVYQGTSDYSAFDLYAGTASAGRYILIAGGEHDPAAGDDVELDSASIYDAVQNQFFHVGPMTFVHDDHTESILLNDSSGNPRALLLGGNSSTGTSLFTFDDIPLFTADFDNDGDVDGNDRTQWESNFGLNGVGDTDNDGDSDGRDFLSWQQQFDSGVESATTSQAVPEPSAAVLWLLSLCCSLIFRSAPVR